MYTYGNSHGIKHAVDAIINLGREEEEAISICP
jgi:hypothetical protein